MDAWAMSGMVTYVLIHGSWHGGWCWDKLASLLIRQGHSVIAPDLPGHGKDRTPIFKITLQSYVDLVCELLDSQTAPVCLVGHSRGGIVISQAAELRPKKIQKLVYLAAFMLRNGETMIQWARQDTGLPIATESGFFGGSRIPLHQESRINQRYLLRRLLP